MKLRSSLALLLALTPVFAFGETQGAPAAPAENPDLSVLEIKLPPDLHAYLKSADFRTIDLRYNAVHNQYRTTVKVNGKDADFHLDSGANASIVSTELAKRLGLKLTPRGSALGIAGNQERFAVHLDSLEIGPKAKLLDQDFSSLAMAGISRPDLPTAEGLIGADILMGIRGILDYGTHGLSFPAPGAKVDVAATARDAGYREIPLRTVGGHCVLDTQFKGRRVRLMVDTGAEHSVLDAAVAKKLRLPLTQNPAAVMGAGGTSMNSSLTTLGELVLDEEVSIRRMPILVLPMQPGDPSAAPYDGIIGADFLHAAGVIFDLGNRKLYIKPGTIDVRPFTCIGGEMFDSNAALETAVDAAKRVIAGRVDSFDLLPDRKTAPDGVARRVVRVTLAVTGTLKGPEGAAGEKVTFDVLIPETLCDAENLRGLFGRNSAKIVFLDPKGEAAPFSTTVWSDGPLPRAQLRRIEK